MSWRLGWRCAHDSVPPTPEPGLLTILLWSVGYVHNTPRFVVMINLSSIQCSFTLRHNDHAQIDYPQCPIHADIVIYVCIVIVDKVRKMALPAPVDLHRPPHCQ